MSEEIEALPALDEFVDRALWMVRQVPAGRVATYGQIAHLSGRTRAARAVGNALRDHIGPNSTVPWQRIINASGGVSFKGDVVRATMQRTLLEAEGVAFSRAGICKLDTYRWQPARAYWEMSE